MADISFNTACKELKIAQIVQLNQLFQLLHLVHIYGHGFYELSRKLMRKNVNNDVSKDSPIELVSDVPWSFWRKWPDDVNIRSREETQGQGRLSQNYFQKFKQMPVPYWSRKMLCVIVPNRRTVSPEFFSWVHTQRILLRHSCPARAPGLCAQGKLLFSTFLTRNEETTDESKKRLECYKLEQFNLPREYSVFDGSKCIVNNRKFEKWRRRESQINNSLTRQNNNFARASRFFVHFFAVNCTTTRDNA